MIGRCRPNLGGQNIQMRYKCLDSLTVAEQLTTGDANRKLSGLVCHACDDAGGIDKISGRIRPL